MINRIIRLDIRCVLIIIFSFILNNIKYSSTAVNHMEIPSKSEYQKNATSTSDTVTMKNTKNLDDDISNCPSNIECKLETFPCIKCNYNLSCIYGKSTPVQCEIKPNVECKGERKFVKDMICKYCYQSELYEYSCAQRGNCYATNPHKAHYKSNCTVNSDVFCLGNRTFNKNIKCNWTQGYKWSTALIISITLGGFGADRFYLGHWQEGIGKLFSFGGLGVWTLIDVILISLDYLGPANGSLFI